MSIPSTLDSPLDDTTVPEIGQLKAYTKLKQTIARQLRALRRHYVRCKNETRAEECQGLMVKLAEDRFTLAVLGQFKRGKSSLMNAVIGRALLPTGVLPLTSAVTVLRYGSEDRVVVTRETSLFPEEVPVERLSDYVTETGNPGNVKGVLTARIEVPVPFLRHGLEFVDTPGIGSAIEANSATTSRFLPQCDAVLFVTSAEAPLSEAEVKLLEDLRQHVGRIFCVVNKMDLLVEDERREVLRFISQRLDVILGPVAVAVVPLSARLGLEAKIKHDAESYQRSGLKTLEEVLADFLANEKASVFLSAVIEKALRMVRDDTTAPGRHASEDAVRATQAQLEVLHQRLRNGASVTRVIEPLATSEPEVAARETTRPEATPKGSKGERLNLWTRGCPVCRHMESDLFDFLARWQHAFASEESAQAAFASKLGFCPLHTWHLVSVSSPQGFSVGYPMLVDRVAARLAASADSDDASMPAVTASSVTCQVCDAMRVVEEGLMDQVASLVRAERERRVYLATQGVCLHHLEGVLKRLPEAHLRRLLLKHAARRMEEWSDEMQNLAMKREAVRRALVTEAEEDAYLRAVLHIAGARNLCTPWVAETRV